MTCVLISIVLCVEEGILDKVVEKTAGRRDRSRSPYVDVRTALNRLPPRQPLPVGLVRGPLAPVVRPRSPPPVLSPGIVLPPARTELRVVRHCRWCRTGIQWHLLWRRPGQEHDLLFCVVIDHYLDLVSGEIRHPRARSE